MSYPRFVFLRRLAFVGLLMTLQGLAALNSSAQQRPSILCVTKEGYGSGAHHRLIARPLVDNGFRVDACDQREIPQKLATGKYNVLVWAPMWDLTYRPDEAEFQKEFPRLQKAVHDFLAEGGGVLVLGPADQTGFTCSWSLTEPWGARLLHESIRDSAGHQTYIVAWAYTTQVFGPAAPGVSGVWYPIGGDPAVSGKWWWPLEVDDHWQIVLKGEKTTTPHFERWSADVDKVRRKKSVTDGVPLAAVRTLGKGRVALVGLPQTYSFSSPYSWPGADVVLYRGLGGKPSGGRRLIFNLLEWLAEPSLQAGLGGATTRADLLNPHRYRKAAAPPPVRWDADIPSHGRFYRGLVGARTVFSTGTSTVAEYARAARAAGVDFIVFLEDHKAMTPEKNMRLRQECREATDATFAAVPGFTIEDEFGNHWFMIGEKATYPDKIYLSEDGKVLAGNYGKGERLARTLGNVMNHLTGGQYQYQVGVGSWNHKKASMPPWDFRNHSAIAVVTTLEDGTLAEDIWEDYLFIQNNGNQVEPYALTIMTSADQVAERAHNSYLNYVRMDRLEDAPQVLGAVRGWADPDQYISNGPEIVAWGASRRFYPGVIGDNFRADLYRMKVRLHVRSPAGLQEVRIYNGVRLFRRFLPGGLTEFRQELELFNVPQQHLVLVVTDRAGRRAISKDLYTKWPDFQEFMCGDRNNQIFNQYTPRKDGSVFYGGPPTGNGVTPDKGMAYWLIIPSYPYAYDERTPKCPWDGGSIAPGYALHLTPAVDVEGAPELPLHNTPFRRLHSPDAMIGEAVIDGAYDEKFRPFMGMVWHTIFPVTQSRYLAGRMRLTYWRTKPEGYTSTLFEESLRFKKDVTLSSETPLRIGVMRSGVDNCHFEIRDKNGRLYSGMTQEVGAPITGELGETGYVCFYNQDPDLSNTAADFKQNASSIFFSWTKGLRFRMTKGMLLLYLVPEKKIKAGAEFHVRILGIGTPLTYQPNAPKRIDAALGITTGKPGYTLQLERGQLLSQRHTLALEGAGIGVAGTIPKADIPAYLPVTVSGLNDHWTTVHLDRSSRRWRPVGVYNGKAYVILDPTEATERFFIGHPVVSNRPELHLQLTQTGRGIWMLEVHNPTERKVTANVSFVKEFTLLRSAPLTVTIEPGRSRVVLLPQKAGKR